MTLPPARVLFVAVSLALAVLGTLVAAMPAAAAADRQWAPQASPSPITAAAAPAWWQGFAEPPLDMLQASARKPATGQPSASAADVATAYIGLRIGTLRARNAAALRDTALEARALVAGRAPHRDAAALLAELDQRIAIADRSATALAGQRDAWATRLAAMTAGDADTAAAALRDAAALNHWPIYRQPVPERLPAAVLLARADVAAAGVPVSVDGWIGPADEPAPIVLPGAELSFEQTLRAAGRDVSASLRQLIDAGRRAAADAQRVQARQLEVQAAQRLLAAGDAAPAEVLEAVQHLLADTDRLATAQGALALAWIQLHAQAPGPWRTAAAAP